MDTDADADADGMDGSNKKREQVRNLYTYRMKRDLRRRVTYDSPDVYVHESKTTRLVGIAERKG